MTPLLTLYDRRLKLVILLTSGFYEWLILPTQAPDIARHLAYARDMEYTKSQAIKTGRYQLEYLSEQLSLNAERGNFAFGCQGKGERHG